MLSHFCSKAKVTFESLLGSLLLFGGSGGSRGHGGHNSVCCFRQGMAGVAPRFGPGTCRGLGWHIGLLAKFQSQKGLGSFSSLEEGLSLKLDGDNRALVIGFWSRPILRPQRHDFRRHFKASKLPLLKHDY